ncbi:MAG: PilZ domain-containing protein [Acidobacteria bacterium]|nr:PilZ domain-containing protein [Acidobacteriota bacterium]
MLKTETPETQQSQQPQRTVLADERRRHIRYERPGCLTFEYRGRHYTGAVVNISKGGVLFLADTPPPLGVWGTLTLQLMEMAQPITTGARVLRSYPTGVAAQFVLPWGELDQYIPWPPHGPDKISAA